VPIVRLLVDSDRNGVAEASESDRAHRAEWTTTHGAMFLANLDDDDGDGYVDAEDDTVNGAADALDLAPLRVDAWPEAPNGTAGSLALTEAARPFVRLFKHTGDTWTLFDPAVHRLSAEEIRAGVEFGVEGRAFPTAAWDGRVEFELTLTDGSGSTAGTDRAVMRVAPLMFGNPLERTERVYAAVVEGYRPSQRFITDLRAALQADGMEFFGIDALDDAYFDPDGGPDVWTQDIMELGWTAIPGPGGALRSMYVALRTPQFDRPAADFAERELLGPNFGFVLERSAREPTARTYDPSLDSFGNLEVIPPHRSTERDYPLGRLLNGRTTRRHGDPVLTALLDAQQMQGPVLYVDTSWLWVGHIDELVSFVPSTRSPRGWVMLIASPRQARQMLQDLVDRDPANANVLMFEGQEFFDSTPGPNYGEPIPAQRTIGAMLGDADLMAFNQSAQARIDRLREQIQSEVGLSDDEIVEIPFLVHDEEAGLATAYMPGTVNLLLYHQTAVVPKSHGAVIAGVDVFDRDMATRLAPHGLTYRPAENWDILHAAGGEVHCGTNALRRIPDRVFWWEVSR
jgi:protein-arginine deiminase